MGSSEEPNKSTKSIIASTASPQSAAVQDSPIFTYINNLSPIKPVKGTSLIQVFSGLNSPPLVFTSPQIRPHRQSIDLKSSHSQLSRQDDAGNITSGINLAPSENSCLENPKNVLLEMTDSMNPKGSSDSYDNEDKGCNVLEESDPDIEKEGKKENYAKSSMGQNPMSNTLGEVGQSQLGKRRRLQFDAPQEKNAEISGKELARNIRNSSPIVSKPSGIGLHLNSVVNAMPLSYTRDGGKKSVSVSSHMQDNIKKCPSISSNSNILENNSSKCEENAHEASNGKAKYMKMLEYEETFDEASLKSEQAERLDEMNRLNPKKKRKKTDSSGDGCKFCNCKKTKCLKLYCDCFAAGIYCADSCSCQGCFNRPEYEEIVIETRQHIESRNPIAFAPKIVHRVTQSSRTQTMKDGDQPASIAGRHKRGCNCKKSMCLKKYCECYQANVGCSDGCRCEGCKNIYGMKGASGVIGEKGMEAINEKSNDLFDDNLKAGSHKPHNLTPQTPSFQCSNHGKDVSKARVFPGKYVLSPESECTLYPNPYYTSTPTSPNDSDMITEASNKNLEMAAFDQESYPNMEFTDEFSPGDWSNNNNILRPQLLGCNSASLCFRGSPVTLFSGTKLSFDDIIDDSSDTPKILKDSCIQQPNKVIATSPNKKRVSPPRIRLHELGSTSLKSGRKFILKAVPSFPPLTPCIDSKENTGGQTSSHPSSNNNL